MSWNEGWRGPRSDARSKTATITNIPTNVQSMVTAAIDAAPEIAGKPDIRVTTHGHIDESHYGVHIAVEVLPAESTVVDDQPKADQPKGEDDGA